MAGRRVYGGSDIEDLLQSEGISLDSFGALIASGSSNGGFHGSRSTVSFEDVCGNRLNQPIYQQLSMEEASGEDFEECIHHQPEKKRRLTADQLQFLERSFEAENKLEPERKIQLAKDLGLQPRQVAIWFQNRRARWKTKQLEKDYEALKSSHNVLKDNYENLLKEKEKLKAEVILLTDKLLLKEKGEKGNTEAIKLAKSPPPFQEPNYNSVSDVRNTETQAMGLKQEELSSTNSAVFDSESPGCADEGGRTPLLEPANSSNAFEPDQSDLSHAGDDEGVREYQFLKLEENSGSFGFPVQEQDFWFWP